MLLRGLLLKAVGVLTTLARLKSKASRNIGADVGFLQELSRLRAICERQSDVLATIQRTADRYRTLAEAQQERIEKLELDLYLARSDHHRATALADELHVKLAKFRT